MAPFDRSYDLLLVCLVPFSSYLMLNNIVTLKSELLEVIENGTI